MYFSAVLTLYFSAIVILYFSAIAEPAQKQKYSGQLPHGTHPAAGQSTNIWDNKSLLTCDSESVKVRKSDSVK